MIRVMWLVLRRDSFHDVCVVCMSCLALRQLRPSQEIVFEGGQAREPPWVVQEMISLLKAHAEPS